jgi:hypothetical protein
MNDYLNRAGRPVQVISGDDNSSPEVQNTQTQKPKKSFFSGKAFRILTAIFLGCVAVLFIAMVLYLLIFKADNTVTSQIKTDQYQAVFLNSADGQVYFGKLADYNRTYYALTDIYYVRVNTVQPDKNNTQTQQNISLAKLGNEIHGPEDAMFIAKDKVLFWENLKESGQVVKAIREYQKTGQQTNPTPTPTATPTPTPTKH